jgi:DNA recombination protein RmuC
MDFILPLIVGLAIGAGVIFLASRRNASNELSTFEPSPQADIAGQVNSVVQSALSEALAALSEQSRRDREESIKLAADRVAEASGERFGKSAQQIDTSLRSVQEDIGRRIAEMDAEIATLREQNTKKFGNVEEAVAALAKTAGDLNSVLSSSQARGQWGERMAEDMCRRVYRRH